IGVLVLFGPKVATDRLDPAEVLGVAGVMFGTLCYSVGSVLSLRMMRTLTPAQMAAMLNFVGGTADPCRAVRARRGSGAAFRLGTGSVGGLAVSGATGLAGRHHDLLLPRARLGRQPCRNLRL